MTIGVRDRLQAQVLHVPGTSQSFFVPFLYSVHCLSGERWDLAREKNQVGDLQ